MNIFEFAMKMELDGKQFYEESATKVDSPELKRILMELAGDEQKHYTIFRALRDGMPVEYEEARKTRILSEVKNVFETLKAQNRDFSFSGDVKEIWVKAQKIEKDSETFYREKANEMTDDKQKNILTRIADEEHKHWVTMENVISFLDRPKHWLEDAEWSHLEDY
ncbi:MAG: ferritin family protein [Candidatus Zixiibacteriota bacterium]|nr:MAG: ferritin family protein [candidate division Zixibacteria bacterium]